MTILYFQLLIIFTLYIASRLGKKPLTLACVTWTVFTFAAVGTSGLLLLQLVTIWMCYWLLSSNKSSASVKQQDQPPSGTVRPTAQTASAANRVIVGPPDTPASAKGFLRSLDTLNSTLGTLTNQAWLKTETTKATASIQQVAFIERLSIERALEGARSELEKQAFFQAHGEQGRAYYEEAHARFSQLLKPSAAHSAGASPTSWQLPDFNLAPSDDPSLHDAIIAGTDKLKRERDHFLSTIAAQIRDDQALCVALRDELCKRGGQASWNCIAPLLDEKVPNRPNLGARNLIEAFPHLSPVKSSQSEATRQSAERTSAIKQRAQALNLPFLVHFTRVENLPSILEHGLCSIATLNQRQLAFNANDRLRLEGHPNAISLSIGHPNDKMFASYRWKNPEQAWAVMVIDPSVLWTYDVAFCAHNAADNRIRQKAVTTLKTLSAFEALFATLDGTALRDRELLPSDPTDVQAEIMLFNTLPPESITGVVFSDQSTLAKYTPYLGNRRAQVNTGGQGFLAARAYVRKSGWTY